MEAIYRRIGKSVLVTAFAVLAGAALSLVFVVPEGKTDAQTPEPEAMVRPATVAGAFYPETLPALSQAVDSMLKEAAFAQIDGEVRALIVPHAGYIYSGSVAASGFKTLRRQYQRVFLMGSNHTSGAGSFSFSIPEVTHYETPLGRVRLSGVSRELLSIPLFSTSSRAHSTHILEVELPFLQKILSDFEIIPIVTGRVTEEDSEAASGAILKYLDSDTLFVVSSDLSHYHVYEKAVRLDKSCIEALAALDIGKASQCEACGIDAALVLLRIARERGWQAKILDYKNSGDTAGDKRRVVGYSSIVFYEEPFSKQEKKELLDISRKVLESSVTKGEEPEVNPEHLSAKLKRNEGCFVTLEKSHQLRGCIGSLSAQEPLFQCVAKNARNAALNDRRFPPVSREELGDIEIEISVLTVPEPMQAKGAEERLSLLMPNRTGVILKRGWHQSTYLPQVWEQLPEKRDFLGRLCQKAGMHVDCWKDPETEVLTYEAIVFGEEG